MVVFMAKKWKLGGDQLVTCAPEPAVAAKLFPSVDTYVLGSIEKLGAASSYAVVGLSEVAGIITDAPADDPTLQQLRERGVNVIQAY
jgi:DeoR/GlpR family transcriptional regulator of sugar metabolism